MILEILFSVFLFALLGGVHCAAMCGGISLAVGSGGPTNEQVITRASSHRWRHAWLRDTLIMQAGRVSTYVMLGTLMGAMGALAWKQDILPLQRSLFGIGSAMLMLSGIWLMRGGALRMPWLEAFAARAVGLTARGTPAALMTRVTRMWRHAGPLPRRYAIGLAWGLVPCGMVYTALALALLAGNARSGALVMAVFGLGTLPNLVALSGLAGWLRRQSRRPGVRTAAGLAVAGFGAAGVARAILLPEVLARHGFCLVL